MFGRKPAPAVDEVADATAAAEATPGATAPKGRPTPSRREAESARKQQLRIPKDPKEAKRAARERERADRVRTRAGMAAGDERYLPARDQGPARSFARDFVDTRFTAAEFFIAIAVLVLALNFVPAAAVKAWGMLVLLAYIALVIADSAILVFQLKRRTRDLFPDPNDRRGLTFYALMRSMQFRRLRLPKPRVRRGGQPIAPKG